MSKENTDSEVCSCGLVHSKDFKQFNEKRNKMAEHIKNCNVENSIQCTNASYIGIEKGEEIS